MKKMILLLAACISFLAGTAEPEFVITSNLDDNSRPVDKLTEIPFVKDREYLMYVIDDKAFNAEKMFYEINIYDEKDQTYKYSTMYSVDMKNDWGYVYKGISFNMPMKLKIRVFTTEKEIATKYIDVVE